MASAHLGEGNFSSWLRWSECTARLPDVSAWLSARDAIPRFLADTLQPILSIRDLRLILPQAPEECSTPLFMTNTKRKGIEGLKSKTAHGRVWKAAAVFFSNQYAVLCIGGEPSGPKDAILVSTREWPVDNRWQGCKAASIGACIKVVLFGGPDLAAKTRDTDQWSLVQAVVSRFLYTKLVSFWVQVLCCFPCSCCFPALLKLFLFNLKWP